MGSAIVSRNLRQSGRTLENLKLAGMSRTALSDMLTNGVK